MESARTFALLGIFDDPGAGFVNDLWSRVERAGVSSPRSEYATVRPHLTFTIFTGCSREEVTAAVDPFLSRRRPMPLECSHVGLFLAPGGMIPFLGFAPSTALLTLQRRVDRAVRECARVVDDRYAPGRWVPHCTLAVDLGPRAAEKFVRIAAKLELPREMSLVGMEITQIDQRRQRLAYEREFRFDQSRSQ